MPDWIKVCVHGQLYVLYTDLVNQAPSVFFISVLSYYSFPFSFRDLFGPSMAFCVITYRMSLSLDYTTFCRLYTFKLTWKFWQCSPPPIEESTTNYLLFLLPQAGRRGFLRHSPVVNGVGGALPTYPLTHALDSRGGEVTYLIHEFGLAPSGTLFWIYLSPKKGSPSYWGWLWPCWESLQWFHFLIGRVALTLSELLGSTL